MNLFGALKRYANKVGQMAIDAEKNNPLYGQVQRGVRQSVSPIMRNFTSQEEVDRYQGFSQPEQPGVVNAGARTAGQIAPYLLPAMATEAAVGPIASKFAAHVPAGTTMAGSLTSGAAKGAITSAPYGWMAGLPYAKSGEERGQNIIEGTLASMLLGTLFGAGVSGLKFKLSDKYLRDNVGRFAVKSKTPSQTMDKTANDDVRILLGKKANEPVYYSDYNKLTLGQLQEAGQKGRGVGLLADFDEAIAGKDNNAALKIAKPRMTVPDMLRELVGGADKDQVDAYYRIPERAKQLRGAQAGLGDMTGNKGVYSKSYEDFIERNRASAVPFDYEVMEIIGATPQTKGNMVKIYRMTDNGKLLPGDNVSIYDFRNFPEETLNKMGITDLMKNKKAKMIEQWIPKKDLYQTDAGTQLYAPKGAKSSNVANQSFYDTKFYRGEGGVNQFQNKTSFISGKNFATDPERAKTFGNVTEYTLNPKAKVLKIDTVGKELDQLAKELGVNESDMISPNALNRELKKKGYDAVIYKTRLGKNGKLDPNGKIVEDVIALNDDAFRVAQESLPNQSFYDMTTKPIKIYRAEDSKTGVSAVANGKYFAGSEDLARQYGDVIATTEIPKGSKILNFDAVKNKPNQTVIPQEIIRDPDKLAKWATDNGYDYIKNTNTKGVEYVQLSNKIGGWEFDSGGAIPGEPLAWNDKYGVLDQLDEAGEATGKFELRDTNGNLRGVFDNVQDAVDSTQSRVAQESLNQSFYDTIKDKVFYHGTTAKFDKFEAGHSGVRGVSGGDGTHGFYFSPQRKTAENFAGKSGNVKEVTLDIKNPKIAKNYMEIGTLDKEKIQQAIKEGYDGYYFKPSPEDIKSGYYKDYNEEIVAFYPEQIKSRVAQESIGDSILKVLNKK